jgi:pSer/pThr/pTyr-binding forkhead associated (FHA) protein
MVQLRILSGKKAGTTWVARRFPVRIGRAASADLQVEENGVWDQHARIDFDRADGFVLSASRKAPARVNGQAVERAVLRNGDAIGMGSLELQFWLGESRQGALWLREWLTWAGIGGICLGQIGLIYWLLR